MTTTIVGFERLKKVSSWLSPTRRAAAVLSHLILLPRHGGDSTATHCRNPSRLVSGRGGGGITTELVTEAS
jgi:hypothetical protein